MYYNKIFKECFKFMVKHEYAPTVIYMNPKYYDELEREMIGAQKRFLIKCSVVLGTKIIIDYDVKDFKLK